MRDKDMQLEWNAPTQKHGELIGFRLRFGIQNQPLIEKILGPSETRFLIEDLGKRFFVNFPTVHLSSHEWFNQLIFCVLVSVLQKKE